MEDGAGKRDSLAAAAGGGANRLLGPALALSAALLAAGMLLPAITVRRLFMANEFSLAEAVFSFLEAGDWFLFLITFVFTMAFPIGKVAVCAGLWFLAPRGSGRAARLAHWLASLSKWSMLDVFVIALMVLVVDGRLLDSADVHAGVIAFTAGVLLSAWAARRIGILHARHQTGADREQRQS